MKKLLLSIFVLLLCVLPASAQDPMLNLDPDLPYIFDSNELAKDRVDQLFLMLLYKQYRENIVYKNAPFKGVSFQMNSFSTQNKIWSDVTFGFGAFTMDFKETGGKDVGGVLFDCPIYMGWEFKLYEQFHFSAGTTFLERRYQDNAMQKMLLINSFLGVTGKFSLNPKEKARKK